MKPKNIVRALSWLLIIGGVAFEIFNGATTYQALSQAIGQWITAGSLALAMVAVDIGGLARIATPQTNDDDEPLFVKILAVIWVIVAIGNAFFTWWGVARAMETTGGVVPAAIRGLAYAIPLVIAVIVLLVRAMLIYSMGIVLDRMINGQRILPQARRTSAYSPVARPVPSNHTQPTYTSENA